MRRAPRGFTLIELMLSVTILAAVVAGISGLLIKQSQASSVQAAQRDLEQSGRLALLELSRAIRLAGYGIDPGAAFDFARFGCTTPGDPGTCNGTGRDRSDAPDELVVAWRDPSFARRVTGLTSSGSVWDLTLDAPLKVSLAAGRIVELMCDGAAEVGYYAVQSTADPVAVGLPQTVRIGVLTEADGFFPSAALTNACYASAVMVLVERVRYYVANDAFGVPALWHDRGRGQEMLFRGIEDVQLSYVVGQPPAGSPFAPGGATPATAPGCTLAGSATWSFGSCPGATGSPSHAAAMPDWRNEAYDSANRYSAHPSNIRMVNIAVVARATRPSADGSGDPVPALFNRPARVRDRYHRAVMTVSEKPVNLLSRGYMLPPRSNDIGIASNVGGG